MHSTFKRVALSIAAMTAASAGLALSSTPASALPPGTPPVAPAILSPLSGGISTTFTLNPTPAGGSFCPGDSASGGYSVRTFMTQQDPATLTYLGSGPVGAGFTQPLYTAAGSPIVANNTAPAAPPSVQGRILGLGNLSFDVLGTVPDGAYSIGLACVRLNETITYYSTQVTFTGNSWAFGATPAAPALGAVSYDAGTTTATVNFTHAASVPATTGYTATLVPVGAAAPIAPIAVPAGATSFPIPGVALGAEYTVTLVATNPTGSSVASNSVTVTGAAVTPAPIVTAPDAFEGNALTVSWTAPASGPAPASYDVAITPGGPTFTAVAGLSQVVPAGLALGGYTATVTPNYPAGSGVTGTAGSDTFSITPNTLIVQEITVTRPPGALILTQRCGVYGDLPAFTAVDAFPGFPRTLAAATASLDQIGTSPDIDLVTPGVQVDPEFGNYPEPQPTTYPTECGLSMGTARFVTSGALAGQFYTASGRLNQVTVLDTRDTDTGWIARGDIETNFTGSTGNTFSGDYLGWIPVVTDTSDPVGGSTYDQLVTAGAPVLPGTAAGLTGNPILGESPVNAGLGIATMDARMQLLIPASADAADYSATLSLTVVPRP
jgi:hypothetical protein